MASSVGGEAIALDGTPNNLYVELADYRPLQYDPGVQYWQVAASQNVAESRQYNPDAVMPSSRHRFRDAVANSWKELLPNAIGLDVRKRGRCEHLQPARVCCDAGREQGWWEAVTEFLDYIHTPTQFTITVNQVNDAPVSSGISDLIMPAGTEMAEVDLRNFFSDPEDGTNLDSDFPISIAREHFRQLMS